MYTFALLAILASSVVANPVPQAVTSDIAPAATAPAGCSASAPGTYVITIANASSPAKREVAQERSLEPRVLSCGSDGTLVITIANGQLHDAKGRTGYVASNYQFQFDGPPQAGAIYTGGFSICGNNSLALGSSAVFYQCLSGTFYNLYDQSTGAQCSPAYIQMNACVGASGFSSVPAATSTVFSVGSTISSTTAVVTPTSISSVAAASTTAAVVTSAITTAFPGGPIVSASNATTSAITTAVPGGPIVSNTTFIPSSASTTASATGSSSPANSTVPTVTTAPLSSGSTTATATASTFTSGAGDGLAAGKQFVSLAAGFAMLYNIISFA
ncbi:hypothetical protein MMC14_008813 [Varicellaria rhodocarpa]|nr:hypothetical protein [Varicellaria rhodocarpa]